MVVNFFAAVESLRGKLEEFRLVHRQGAGETTLRPAVNQLQEELDTTRVLLNDAGEGAWRFFPDEQRWGYMLLLSLAETGRLEIKNI